MVDFTKIYRKYLRSKMQNKSVEEVKEFISSLGFSAVEVKEHTCNSFVKIDGFLIHVDTCKGFFPKLAAKELNKNESLSFTRDELGKVDFIVPPFMRNEFVWEFTSAISNSKTPDSTALSFARRMYPVSDIAAIFTEYYQKNHIIGKYYDQLVETLKAFYLGLYSAAITSIIPPMEAIVRDIGVQLELNCQDDVGKEQLIEILKRLQRRIIDRNVFQNAWVPSDFKSVKLHDQFNEQIQMIESLKYFLENRLYQHTSNYLGTSNLNRNGIVHGFLTDFNSEVNYYRLITVMNMLYVCSSLIGKGSLFHPNQSNESKVLEHQLTKIKIVSLSI